MLPHQQVIHDAVGAVLERPEIQGILGRVASFIDRGASVIDRATKQQPRPQPTNGTPPPPQQPVKRREDPRVILGFAPGTVLTVAAVKQRRRELAKLFHGDHGGNDEAMRRVNAATEVLLKSLAK